MKLKTGEKQDELTEETIMRSVAHYLKLPFKKINPLELDLDVVTKTIAKPFALKHLVVPLTLENGGLLVAMYNPLDHEALDAIKQVSRLTVYPAVSTKTDIIKTIAEFYGFTTDFVGTSAFSDFRSWKRFDKPDSPGNWQPCNFRIVRL